MVRSKLICYKERFKSGHQIAIVITVYSPSFLDHATSKGPFGLPVKLPTFVR